MANERVGGDSRLLELPSSCDVKVPIDRSEWMKLPSSRIEDAESKSNLHCSRLESRPAQRKRLQAARKRLLKGIARVYPDATMTLFPLHHLVPRQYAARIDFQTKRAPYSALALLLASLVFPGSLAAQTAEKRGEHRGSWRSLRCGLCCLPGCAARAGTRGG